MLEIIDNQNAVDDVLKNSKMLKALLAISAKYTSARHNEFFKLFYHCKKILAHALKKFPDIMKLNLLRTKSNKLRFTKEDIIKFW